MILDSAYDFVRFAGRAKIDEDSVNFFIKVVLQGICDQSDATLLIPWARMKENECHANVRWYVENDPTKLSRAASGWHVQWPNFVFHSVLRNGDQHICITPTPLAPREFHFIPDDKITWQTEGQALVGFRDGERIGSGVRKYPAFTLAQGAIVRERLLAGMNPYRAIEFSEEEMENLKRMHIP